MNAETLGEDSDANETLTRPLTQNRVLITRVIQVMRYELHPLVMKIDDNLDDVKCHGRIYLKITKTSKYSQSGGP